MVAGLEEVDAGGIFIGDRDVTDIPPKHRDVAMVFQNYALYPYLTVRRTSGSRSASRTCAEATATSASRRSRSCSA